MDNNLLKKFNEIEKVHWWWEGRRQILSQLITRKRKQKVLDMGFGTGETMSYLQKILSSAFICGIDASIVAVRFAKSRGHKNALKGSATKLPYKTNTFDTTLALDVIEHIKDDQKVINEMFRVLKPGGEAIITVPALPFIWSKHDSGQGHKRRYTRRRLVSLAKKAGFQIKFISYFNFILSPVIILIRLVGRLKPFNKLGEYDSKLNYDISFKKNINQLLKAIFITEVKMLKKISYPIGISVAAKFIKPNA